MPCPRQFRLSQNQHPPGNHGNKHPADHRRGSERWLPQLRRLTLAIQVAAAPAFAWPACALADDLDRTALENLFHEPVTTSATGKPQRASDAPVAMDIITAEQIRRSGAHDIPSILARYTSLDVVQFGPSDYAVGVRGYTTALDPRLLVLLDGRQVYLDDYGRTSWSEIPVQLSEIRQIEVVRGPNSALFGYNAAAGVINIVTYNPAYDHVTNLVLRADDDRYGELSGAATGPLPGNGGMRISAGLRKDDAFTEGYQVLDNRSLARDAQLATTVEFGLGGGVRAGIDASYAADNGPGLTGPIIEEQNQAVWSLRGRLSDDTLYGLINASAYFNGFNYALNNVPAWQQGTGVMQLSDTLKLGASTTIRPFVEYRQSSLDESDAVHTEVVLSGQSRQVGYHVGSLGGMWNWEIAENLEWTAALRYDQLWLNGSGYDVPGDRFPDAVYDQRAFGTLAWNAGLVWKLDRLDTIRLSLARGIQPPSLLDLGLRLYSSFENFTGSPFAPATVVDDYEAGYRRRLPALATDLDLTVYTQTNHDLGSSLFAIPVPVPGGAVPTTTPTGIGSSRVSGVEAALLTHPGNGLEFGLQYRSAYTAGHPAPSLVDYQTASPRHVVSAHAGWSMGKVEIDLFGHFSSSAAGYRLSGFADELVTVRDYVTASGRIAYRAAPWLTIAMEGEDLLAAHQMQSIGLLAERRVFLSLRTDF